jgi:hypothetical protein
MQNQESKEDKGSVQSLGLQNWISLVVRTLKLLKHFKIEWTIIQVGMHSWIKWWLKVNKNQCPIILVIEPNPYKMINLWLLISLLCLLDLKHQQLCTRWTSKTKFIIKDQFLTKQKQRLQLLKTLQSTNLGKMQIILTWIMRSTFNTNKIIKLIKKANKQIEQFIYFLKMAT